MSSRSTGEAAPGHARFPQAVAWFSPMPPAEERWRVVGLRSVTEGRGQRVHPSTRSVSAVSSAASDDRPAGRLGRGCVARRHRVLSRGDHRDDHGAHGLALRQVPDAQSVIPQERPVGAPESAGRRPPSIPRRQVSAGLGVHVDVGPVERNSDGAGAVRRCCVAAMGYSRAGAVASRTWASRQCGNAVLLRA